MMPYAWLGPEQDSGDREQWFGIQRHDATPKPAATAYAAAVKQMRGLTGTPPSGTVAICSPAEAPAPAAKKPKRAVQLAVKVREDRKRPGRVLLDATCKQGCRLQVSLLAQRNRREVRVARRTARLGTRTKTLSIAVPRREYRNNVQLLRVDVVATATDARSTRKSHTLRLRRAPAERL